MKNKFAYKNMSSCINSNIIVALIILILSTNAYCQTPLWESDGYNSVRVIGSSDNTFLGWQSGLENISGTKNVFLGYRAGYQETGSNKLYIDITTTDSPLIYGEFDNNLLRVNGDLKVKKTFEIEDGLVSYGINKYAPYYGFYMDVNASVTGGWARNLGGAYHGGNRKGVIYALGSGPNLTKIGIDATGLFYNSKQFIVHSNGNIGINTSTPSEKLEVDGNVKIGGVSTDADLGFVSTATGNSEIKFTRGSSSAPFFQIRGFGSSSGTKEETAIIVNDNAEVEAMRFKANGEIIFKEKIFAEATIKTTEVQVQPSPWPDYVFSSTYKLAPLSEVEKHITDNGHLKNIPSEAEVAKKGIALGEMNAKLLEKIEELTLYLIEQNKMVKEQKEGMDAMREKINSLEEKVIVLESKGN